MRRFRFKLEKLLELRSFHEKKAELFLALKAGRCARLQGKLGENAESRHRTAKEMFAPGRGLEDYRAANLFIIRLDREKERLLEELAMAELEKEAARKDYMAKHTARESLDKLKERRQTEYYRLAERDETKTLDDLAGQRAAVARG